MSVTLPADEWEDIYLPLYGYFETYVGDDGANSLNDVYELGLPAKDGDVLIWKLIGKPVSVSPTFTHDEIDELERDVHLVKTSDYPADVKKAVSDLLDLLKNDGIKPPPKGAQQAGKRSRKARKTRKARKAKKTRKH